MAIAPNQLKTQQLAASAKENLNDKTDAAKKEAASSSPKVASSKTSLKDKFSKALDKINKPHTIDINIFKQNGGFFSNLICCKLPSIKLRLPKYKFSFNRKLNFDLSFNLSICGKEKKINPFDSVMNMANVIRKNPGLLSPNKKDRLNALLRSDILPKMNILGLGSAIPTCVLGKSVGSILGSDNTLGPTLRSRNTLKTLMYQDPCTAALANQPLLSKWLSNSSAASLLSTLISGDKDKAYSYVDIALGVLGQRESVIGSLLGALAYSYDYNTRNKLDLIDRVFNSGKLTGADFINLQGNASNILKDLDAEKKEKDLNSKDPSKDLDKYLNILNKLDPTWNSNNNFHQTNGNQTLAELSKGKLQNIFRASVELTGVYTTKLEPMHHIAIINQFNPKICKC